MADIVDVDKRPEEGARCHNFGIDCCGRLIFKQAENCSCHIRPPCSACTSAPLVCTDCGEEYSSE